MLQICSNRTKDKRYIKCRSLNDPGISHNILKNVCKLFQCLRLCFNFTQDLIKKHQWKDLLAITKREIYGLVVWMCSKDLEII